MWTINKSIDYRLSGALYVRLALLGAFFYVAIITAWLSDDIFISLRQVWNFIHGEGLTYNWGQRVQAFTHPSWFFVLSAASLMTKELFYTTLICNIACSILALILLLYYEVLSARQNTSSSIKLALLPCAIALLIFSKSFTDYLTSGLENGFSFLLASLALIQAKKIHQSQQASQKTLRNFMTLLALLVLTRFDYAVLFLPLLLWGLSKSDGWKTGLRSVLPGGTLIITWLLFSIVYFGVPLPNTFYAKLGTLYPIDEILQHGWKYFLTTWKLDPVTLIIIIMGIVSGFLKKDRRTIAISIGICLYLAFIYRSGGDFMQGRFLSILVFVSAFNILDMDDRFYPPTKIVPPFSASLLGLVVVISTFTQFPFLSDRHYTNREWVDGIADERGYYYQSYGMLSLQQAFPKVKGFTDSAPTSTAIACGGLGHAGLSADGVFMIDSCGLTDPFISHLPAIHSENWRIGHHERKIPTNYPLFLVGKADGLIDTELNPLLQDIQLLSTGSLFRMERFRAIARVNLGNHYNFSRERYASPDIQLPITSFTETVTYENVNHQHLANGEAWNKPGNIIFLQSLIVKLQHPVNGHTLNLSLDNNDRYELLVNNSPVPLSEVKTATPVSMGLKNYVAELPEAQDIDLIQINASGGDNVYALGHLNVGEVN